MRYTESLILISVLFFWTPVGFGQSDVGGRPLDLCDLPARLAGSDGPVRVRVKAYLLRGAHHVALLVNFCSTRLEDQWGDYPVILEVDNSTRSARSVVWSADVPGDMVEGVFEGVIHPRKSPPLYCLDDMPLDRFGAIITIESAREVTVVEEPERRRAVRRHIDDAIESMKCKVDAKTYMDELRRTNKEDGVGESDGRP